MCSSQLANKLDLPGRRVHVSVASVPENLHSKIVTITCVNLSVNNLKYPVYVPDLFYGSIYKQPPVG